MKTAEFTVSGFNPHRPRPLIFQHPQKGLVGVAQPPKNRGDSITVQLQPGATVTGRLVDADGRPRPGVELVVQRDYKEPRPAEDFVYFPPSPTRRISRVGSASTGLLPGYEFALSDGKRRSAPGRGTPFGRDEGPGRREARERVTRRRSDRARWAVGPAGRHPGLA